jgi:putative glutamine amidotransferase
MQRTVDRSRVSPLGPAACKAAKVRRIHAKHLAFLHPRRDALTAARHAFPTAMHSSHRRGIVPPARVATKLYALMTAVAQASVRRAASALMNMPTPLLMRAIPIVGVTADAIMKARHPSHIAGEKYLTAVIDGSNALALIVPALGARQANAALVEAVDGLLFTGSRSNVEPHHYGGAASERGTLHDPARDATTLPLMRAAIDSGVPVLAICRGFQEMNVVFGGTLHQHVHAVEGYDDHRENLEDTLDMQYGPAHTVRLTRGGLLHRLANGIEEVRVNSLHAQGIERLGAGLVTEAVAHDGLIEAISVKNAEAFALGVQWHPEWRHAADPLAAAIFKAFGDACRTRMHSRHRASARAQTHDSAGESARDGA